MHEAEFYKRKVDIGKVLELTAPKYIFQGKGITTTQVRLYEHRLEVLSQYTYNTRPLYQSHNKMKYTT